MKELISEKINTIIFDIGKVLVDFSWETYLDSFGYDKETYEHVADAMFRSEDWSRGDMGATAKEWLQLFLENAPAYEKEIREVFADFGKTILPLEYTEPWIRSFRDYGFKLYYLSNYSEEMYRQTKEKLAFTETLDGGIFSWKEKCIKPDPEIYRRLLERYDIRPEEALFFDDVPENVAAAETLGITGVVFTPHLAWHMIGK